MADRINWAATPIVNSNAVGCPHCKVEEEYVRQDTIIDDEGKWRYLICKHCSKPFRNFVNSFHGSGSQVFWIDSNHR